jgi:hypothetical protein
MHIFKAISNLFGSKSESKKISNDGLLIIEEDKTTPPGELRINLSLAPGAIDNLLNNNINHNDNISKIKNNISLVMKSSSNPDIIYEIIFNNTNGIIDIKCNCPAGEFTKLCKHKLSLIRGDSSNLLDYSAEEDWLTVKGWIEKSPFKNLIIEHDLAEKNFQEAQKSLKKIKEKIERAMREGI